MKHRQVDVFAIQIDVAVVPLVARLEHHVDLVAQRIEQVQEQVEHRFARGGPHQHGDFDPRVGVLVDVVPVARARNDLQVVRGPHRVGQHEVAVAGDIQMRFELLFRDVLEAAPLAAEPILRGSVFGKNRCRKLIDWVPRMRIDTVTYGAVPERGNTGPATSKEL